MSTEQAGDIYPPPPDATRSENVGVLVVEDDGELCEELADALRQQGHQVVTASNGREALAVLARSRPAVVVLDMLMPVMSGAEFLEEVQRDPDLSSIPVFVVTAALHARPAHGGPVFFKPINMTSLLRAVRGYMS